MPQPDSDIDDKNNNVEDDPKDVKPGQPAPSLDQVHQITQAKVEDEDADNGDDTDGEGSAGANDADDDKEGDGEKSTSSEDDKKDDTSDSVTSTNGSDTDSSASEDKSAGETATDTKTEPAAQLDTDTTKPGEGKIAIVDAEGKTHYFNSLEEVPKTFEPENYQVMMVAAGKFAKKEIADEKQAADDAAQAVKDKEVADTKARTDAMNTEWENDAKNMTVDGTFPNEPKKLEEAKAEVYGYIESELKKFNDTDGKDGSIQTNFRTAYKNMMYDKEQEAKVAKQKENDEAKKKRGGMVQGGSGGNNNPTGSIKGKTIEAPPPGVGLDAVHNRAIENLG